MKLKRSLTQTSLGAARPNSYEKSEILWAQFDKNWCHYRFKRGEICWPFVRIMSLPLPCDSHLKRRDKMVTCFIELPIIKTLRAKDNGMTQISANESNGWRQERGAIDHLQIDQRASLRVFSCRTMNKALDKVHNWLPKALFLSLRELFRERRFLSRRQE